MPCGPGCGVRAMEPKCSSCWRTDTPTGLLAEVESPATAAGEEERRERCRRVAFYQRCGMVHSGIRCLLFGVTYDILWLPGDSSRQPGPLLDKIYRKVLPGALWDHLRYL